MSWSTSELRVRWAPWNRLKPSSKIFLMTVRRRYFFCGSFVLFMSSVCNALRLCIAALWSPAGKGLTSWFLFVMFNCVFVTFPCGILGQWWYLMFRLLFFAIFLLKERICSLWEHILFFNSSPFLDVACYMVFSTWKHIPLFKSWVIITDTNILYVCVCPFMAYCATKFESVFRSLII